MGKGGKKKEGGSANEKERGGMGLKYLKVSLRVKTEGVGE